MTPLRLAFDQRLLHALPRFVGAAGQPHDPLVYYNLACSYSLNDQFDLAVAALEKALNLGYCDFAWLAKDPDLRKLRKQPLYQRIQEKIRGLRIKVR